MFKKNNRYKLLKIFLDSPTDSFRLREIARLSKISPASVLNYLKEFEKDGLIEKYVKREIPFYVAKREDGKFILYKKLSIIYELDDSGLVNYLWDELSPDAIILYGSYAKGESTEESDVDIFIIGKSAKINLSKYEKILGKEIHLMFDEAKNISAELKNNLINGIIMKGYFKAI